MEDNTKGDYESQEVSSYNEAGLQISRLHELWLRAESYASSGMLDRWSWTLDSIYRELSSDIYRLSDSEDLKIQNKLYSKFLRKAKVKRQIYIILNDRHEFLKSLQDRVGKGGKYVEGDTEGF